MKHLAKLAGIGLAALGIALSAPRPAVASNPAPAHVVAPRASFYLKDGDRVVFYGDSITDQRQYTTYIESYCISRFPKKHFTFVHSGWGGDRVTGGGGGPIDLRLQRDVIAYHPTVVTICLGMNDGSYQAFNPGIFETYVNGYRHILDTLIKTLPSVRITLITASAYDDVTRAPGFPAGYNATLVAYGEAVKTLGAQYGLTVADSNAPLVGALARINKSDPDLATKILPDRVHPGPGGHIIMASALLKAWNAPSTVAEVQIDAASHQLVRHENTRVSGLQITPEKITFTHLDNALPWPIDRDPARNPDSIAVLGATDIEQSLDHYTLRITGLTAPSYAVKVDGKPIGTLDRAVLESGVDLANIPGLPPNVQANELLGLIRRHNDIHFERWRSVQEPATRGGRALTPDIQAKMDALDKQEEEVVAHIRTACVPMPHTVELTPGS